MRSNVRGISRIDEDSYLYHLLLEFRERGDWPLPTVSCRRRRIIVCEACGLPELTEGPRTKYCRDCAPEQYRQYNLRWQKQKRMLG